MPADAQPRTAQLPTPAEIIARSVMPMARDPNGRSRVPLDPVEIIARAAGTFIARPGAGDHTSANPLSVLASAIAPSPRTEPAPPLASAAQPTAGEALEGDPQATFWRLWMEHHNYLRRQSLRLMAGNMADAEDALSNAMLKALQKFGAYAGSITNERAWLTRLVHNVCMDLHRNNHRIGRSIDDITDDELGGASLLDSGGRTPEDEVVARRSIADLAQQLERMPASLREPLLMRVLDELSYDEIGERLKLSNVAVRKRIQLARDFLRKSGIGELCDTR